MSRSARPPVDPRQFWNDKILGWEECRYARPAAASSITERWAARLSSSLRFRQEAALALLAPQVRGRRVVELGCGSGLLAERLLAAGATGYHGFDLSDAAIGRAREKARASSSADRMRFDVAAVGDLDDQGDALVFSLGLFDWLNPGDIAHAFAIGRGGSYLHAVAEKQASLTQLIHRSYVHLAYGRRTGYAPRYHSVAEIEGALAAQGLPPCGIYRHRRMRFGIFVTDLPLQGGRQP